MKVINDQLFFAASEIKVFFLNIHLGCGNEEERKKYLNSVF